VETLALEPRATRFLPLAKNVFCEVFETLGFPLVLLIRQVLKIQ
jgi:hypothetical protein